MMMRPEPVKEVTWKELWDGIYEIMCPPVGFFTYLVLGSKKALLVDTGMGIGSLKSKISEITPLPVEVICTHGHPDHAGGVAEFGSFMLCPADFDVYEKMATLEFRTGDVSRMPGGEESVSKLQPTGPAPTPVEDGQIIDLGDRTLKVIYAPGHTHGSICILDEQTGTLFTGDNVQGRETAIREWNSSSVKTYHESLLRLKALEPKKLLAGHRPNVNPPEQIDKLLAISGALLNGERGEERPARMGGNVSFVYEVDGVSICYSADKL